MNTIRIPLRFLLNVMIVCTINTVSAGEADVISVRVQHNGGDSFQFITTVEHADTGWKHYANAWEVLDMDGNVIGKRVLHHPHVDEQPFTRSMRLTVPPGIKKVQVRAVDSIHDTGGKIVVVNLPR